MTTDTHVPLKTLTTMRLGGSARRVITVTSSEELHEAYKALRQTGESYFVLGGGSNVIATDTDFDGTILLNRIEGFELISEDSGQVLIRIGAGENWDHVVARCCDMGLSGIEAMSAIPGTAGATPVQNVGAYGQEVAHTLVELEALDTDTGAFVTLSNQDCGFSYRNSIFKNPSKRHHIISTITLRLTRTPMSPPFYDSLQKYLDTHSIADTSPSSIRTAVQAIRAIKLPDPTIIANTGSFFKNPILPRGKADTLLAAHPGMPHFPMPGNQIKVAAGWLIEQAGLKGFTLRGMKTYENNALVLVNEAANSYADLEAIRQHIVKTIETEFGITLEQEPEVLAS